MKVKSFLFFSGSKNDFNLPKSKRERILQLYKPAVYKTEGNDDEKMHDFHDIADYF